MFENFGLILQTNIGHDTTRNNTCIDLAFARNTCIKIQNYTSYFSYHFPILCKINIETEEL